MEVDGACAVLVTSAARAKDARHPGVRLLSGEFALGASLRLRHGAKRRDLPLEAFFLAYGKQDRAPGEFVKRLAVARHPQRCAVDRREHRLEVGQAGGGGESLAGPELLEVAHDPEMFGALPALIRVESGKHQFWWLKRAIAVA